YPFNLTIGPLISALAAGCPVIIKPSELTPHTSELIHRMISELFKPSEVMVFQGGVDMAKSLLALPFDHIFFTGSPSVGKIVMEAAAKNLTSVTLELGGKSPVIISPEADLKDAAEKLIGGKYINAAQTCVAPDYIFAHSEVKERLILEMKSAIQRMYDPNFEGIEKSKDLARIINEKNFDRLNAMLKDAIQLGAKIEFGGSVNQRDRFIEPTLLTNINHSMKIMQEEIFGPLLPILEYSELDHAISFINANPKPLALYYFGKKGQESSRVLKETSSGNAVLNDCVIHFLHPNLPFGGVNNSGIGSAHGHFGFLAFSHQKGVLSQRVGYNNVSLMRPPYTTATRELISKLIKWL
ncbi:MAG: aldehyde dehydrogenase family protein, partial [Algoriphagus sp.]